MLNLDGDSVKQSMLDRPPDEIHSDLLFRSMSVSVPLSARV